MIRRARGRYRPGEMNGLERQYQMQLEAERNAGLILWYAFESVKFKLADKTYYTPDFLVLRTDGSLEVHEVKGFWEDDARVKIKCAAEKFPIVFKAIKLDRKKRDWSIEEF